MGMILVTALDIWCCHCAAVPPQHNYTRVFQTLYTPPPPPPPTHIKHSFKTLIMAVSHNQVTHYDLDENSRHIADGIL